MKLFYQFAEYAIITLAMPFMVVTLALLTIAGMCHKAGEAED